MSRTTRISCGPQRAAADLGRELEPFAAAGAAPVGDERGDIDADQLARREAEERLGARVGDDDHPVGLDDEDRVGRRLEDRAGEVHGVNPGSERTGRGRPM